MSIARHTLERPKERDRERCAELEQVGCQVLIICECEVNDIEPYELRLDIISHRRIIIDSGYHLSECIERAPPIKVVLIRLLGIHK